MKRYIRYLAHVFSMTLGGMVQYRADFVMRIMRALLETIIAVITINAFYAHLPVIAGWSRHEAFMIYALFYMIGSFVMMIFGHGMDNLYREIIAGDFDRYLIQPLEAQIAAGTRFIYITNIFRFVFSLGWFWYALSHLSLDHFWWEWLIAVGLIISGTITYYSIIFLSSILAFWTFSGEAWYLTNTITLTGRYPLDFFPKGVRVVFYAIPLAFVAYIPAMYILDRQVHLAIFSPFIAIVSLWFVRQVWKAGLKSYSSASS